MLFFSRKLFCIIGLVAVVGTFPTLVWAQGTSDYPLAFRRYLQSSGHKAAAISASGSWAVETHANSAEFAKRQALKSCNARSKRGFGGHPCYLVDVDGKFVVPNGRKLLTSRLAMPVSIEMYDGKTGETSRLPGILLPDFGHFQKGERRIKVSLVTQGLKKLCEGTYTYSRPAFFYTMRCFGKYRFKGRSNPTVWKTFGVFAAPVVSLKLTHSSSYIDIKTR